MARRPVFVAGTANLDPWTRANIGQIAKGLHYQLMVDFAWSPGFALVQKRKNIQALHQAAQQKLREEARGPASVLEVSSKSDHPLGRALSAFNLTTTKLAGYEGSNVEALYQGSKVFADDNGPFIDIYKKSARAAKGDERIKRNGPLKSFRFNGHTWDLDSPVSFYDWLYITILAEDPTRLRDLRRFKAFTDIEFNSKNSRNCQARSCAMAVALDRNGILDTFLDQKNLDILSRSTEQPRLL